MESYKLVLPEHLNHYGFLFGGYLLKFTDEVAWIAATLDYPGYLFVTIAMDKVEFRKSVREGTILRFRCLRVHEGRTSVRYQVEVFRSEEEDAETIFSTTVTLVRVDENGEKKPLAAPR